MKKAANKRVGKKISHLMKGKENVPQKQAVAMALSMERAHRLTDEGDYQPVKKKNTDMPEYAGDADKKKKMTLGFNK